MKIQNEILQKVKELNLEAFTINDILGLSSYDNLRKNLERMTSNNTLRRLIRGVYDIPRFNETFNMYNAPSIDGIAKAVARHNNWNIYPSGNYALNILGLSTQIPNQYVYISSGPYKKYEYEGNIIEFKHASLKETNSYSYLTNLVIQAFKEIGKENINQEIIDQIKRKLTNEEIDNICKEGKNTTIWIYENIIKLRGKENEKNSSNEKRR